MANRSTRRMAALIGTAVANFLVALTGINAQAEEQRVTVCIESGVALQESIMAQAIAGKMFADIGIKIDWHKESKCPTEQDGVIHIRLNTGVTANLYPGALAIALPYEGVRIQVFVDRVRILVIPRIVPTLLAHVLAHEITHILEGVSRHSETGVMKARWNQKDYEDMAYKPLPFAKDDIRFLHYGLQARAAASVQVSQLAAPAFPEQ